MYKQDQSPSKRGLKGVSSQTRNSTATPFFFFAYESYICSLKGTCRWQCGATGNHCDLVTCSKINFSLIIFVYMHNSILLQLVCTFSRVHTLIFSVTIYIQCNAKIVLNDKKEIHTLPVYALKELRKLLSNRSK